MSAPIDYAGLVSAIILFLTAVTLAINLANQRRLVEMRDVVHEINGNIQKQLEKKEDKPTVIEVENNN